MLIVPNAGSKPVKFSLKDIEVFVDSEEQNWFKRAQMGKFLGIEDIRTSLNGLAKCEILTRQELSSYQSVMVHQVGLDPKVSKTRRINSYYSLGSYMSL